MRRLNRVTGDRAFAHGATAHVDVDLGGRFAFGVGELFLVSSVVVVFNVVAGDLQIADL